MRAYIPNIITVINLICGCCAVACVFYQDFQKVLAFFLVGGIADYCDGLVARWLNVKSSLGKELDSIADMVTFGVLPGAILYMLLVLGMGGSTNSFELMAAPGFILSAFAGLRLAKFNIDTRQAEDFIGLSTPSCTIFVVGLMLIYQANSHDLSGFVINNYFLYAVIVVFSYLLVSEIPMVSFKFKGLKWKGNERRIIFILMALILLVLFKEVAFSLFIIVYVLFSLIDNFIGVRKAPGQVVEDR